MPSFDRSAYQKMDPKKVKAAGISILLFVCLAYFGYAALNTYRWNIEAKNWIDLQGTYRFSETMPGPHFSEYAVLRYEYGGRLYTPRVQLVDEQMGASLVHQDERTLLMKVDPSHPERFFPDLRSVIKGNAQKGATWAVVLVLWYFFFDRLEPMITSAIKKKGTQDK